MTAAATDPLRSFFFFGGTSPRFKAVTTMPQRPKIAIITKAKIAISKAKIAIFTLLAKKGYRLSEKDEVVILHFKLSSILTKFFFINRGKQKI